MQFRMIMMPTPFLHTAQKFAAINGILIPGGGASLQDGPFYRAAEKLFDVSTHCHTQNSPYVGLLWKEKWCEVLNIQNLLVICVHLITQWALEANDNGDYFPIYGVCLGYELLTILVTKVCFTSSWIGNLIETALNCVLYMFLKWNLFNLMTLK